MCSWNQLPAEILCVAYLLVQIRIGGQIITTFLTVCQPQKILCLSLILCNAFCYTEVSCNLISHVLLCEVFSGPVTKYPSSPINWGENTA